MTDQSKAQDILRKRSLLQQQRLNRQSEPQPQPDIQPLYYVAREAGSGRAVLRSRSGEIRRGGEIITNAQIQPGQRVLSAGETINQITAPYERSQPRRRRPEIFNFGSMVYLIEEIYDTEELTRSSCESEVTLSAVFIRRKNIPNNIFILYETIQAEERIACTCPTYNRLGNRCLPVCDGTGQYTTLQQCLAAPEPPWPNPAGEDGGGGYVVMYAGYRIGEGYGSSIAWGGMNGGLFYQSEASQNPCSAQRFFYVDHLAPTSWVNARPGEFPGGNRTQFWTYYSLPMNPMLDESAYPTGAVLVSGKNTLSTTGYRQVDQNGWFLFATSHSDIWIQGNPGYWYSGPTTSYFYYFVYKYVPASSFNGTSPPSPPSSIGGMNISGVTLFQNRAALICSPFNQRPDPTCQDPGQGRSAIACPYPEEKRSRRYWHFNGVSGQKQLIHSFNYSDPREMYLVGKDYSLIRMLAGKNPNNSWCKIIDSKISNGSFTKQTYSNPVIPPADPKDWRSPLFNYNYSNNQNLDSLPPYIRNNIRNQFVNISSYQSTDYRLSFREDQAAQSVNQQNQPIVWGKFSDLIKQNNKIGSARVCLAPFEGNTSQSNGESTLTGKGITVNNLFSINEPQANIISISAYISESKLPESYGNSTAGCLGNIYRRALQERWYSGKQNMITFRGNIEYNDRYPPQFDYSGSSHRLTVKNCQNQTTQVITANFGGTLELYGTEEIIGLCP